LISGGLDSLLAARIVKEQGIDVRGIAFDSGFFHLGRPGTRQNARGQVHPWVARVEKVAEQAGVPLEIVDVSPEFYRMLLHPDHGYGAHVNPCIDCKILFLREAKRRLEALGGDFLVTGEVAGQRPMSQNRTALDLIERRAGVHDLLLRPLSALCLAPVRAEREGLVDRTRLLGISGRTRKPQMELAARWGITDYAQPAGGCVLADAGFARRLEDFKSHLPAGAQVVYLDMVRLRLGRHFRLAQGSKVIIGRHEAENDGLEEVQGDWAMIRPSEVKGPVALASGPWDETLQRFVLGAVARYSDAPGGQAVGLEWHQGGALRTFSSQALNDADLAEVRL
jgi:tRNA U34 2-thiouridine synthase MnmA/TrmU